MLRYTPHSGDKALTQVIWVLGKPTRVFLLLYKGSKQFVSVYPSQPKWSYGILDTKLRHLYTVDKQKLYRCIFSYATFMNLLSTGYRQPYDPDHNKSMNFLGDCRLKDNKKHAFNLYPDPNIHQI